VSKRTLPLVTLALGIATLIAFVALGNQPDVRAAYPNNDVSIAVSAFQRAETVMDIAQGFGSPADPARVAAMDALNRLDLAAFIPAYTLFLIAAAVMLGGLRNRWTQVAIAFALVGAAGDVVETSRQLQLTAHIDAPQAWLPIAPWHWLKYAGLALSGVALASLCFTAENKRWILGVIALAPFPLVALSYMGALSTRVFAAAFAIYWIALLVIALMDAVRGRGSPA
jgi:hypothetical protein